MCGCGGGACIPQREYDRPRTDPLPQYELQEMILFNVGGKCGYPLVDTFKKQYTGLDGRDEKMFVDSKSSISIRLEVRSLHLQDRMAVLNSVVSGCRMRSGRSRLVPTPMFHCIGTNEFYRFEH